MNDQLTSRRNTKFKMAVNFTRCIFLESKINVVSKSYFSTSSVLNWRTRKDVAINKTPEYVRKDEYYYQEHPSDEWLNIPMEKGPRNAGPLRDKPDFSFVDGRPKPLGVIQKKKLDRQRMFCEKIVALSKEMDLSKALYQEQLRQQQQIIDNRLGSKLKAKGVELLKAKSVEKLKSQQAKKS